MSNFMFPTPIVPAQNSVNNAAIQDGAVNTRTLAALAVATTNLIDRAVTSIKIALASITGAHLSAHATFTTSGFPVTGAGSIAIPGATAGQRVSFVCILDTIGGGSTDGTSNFESTISVDGYIQQTGGTYSGKLAIVSLINTI